MANKRKIDQAAGETAPEVKKAKKIQKGKGKEVIATAASSRTPRSMNLRRSRRNSAAKSPDPKKKTSKSVTVSKATGEAKATKVPKSRDKISNSSTRKNSEVSVEAPRNEEESVDAGGQVEHEGSGVSYWLMKAEPESRIVNGKDVKFSIDDLKEAETPEAWDGVRNYVARNNMRAMKKGDLAFFYHSNCKVPGVVGTMEIVQEHSVDETAQDPNHPYYDAKSKAEDPKWSVVHVEFRGKFPEVVSLKELQSFSKNGGVLEDLQVLKSTRLSVSKVSKKEWDFISNLVKPDEDTAL